MCTATAKMGARRGLFPARATTCPGWLDGLASSRAHFGRRYAHFCAGGADSTGLARRGAKSLGEAGSVASAATRIRRGRLFSPSAKMAPHGQCQGLWHSGAYCPLRGSGSTGIRQPSSCRFAAKFVNGGWYRAARCARKLRAARGTTASRS